MTVLNLDQIQKAIDLKQDLSLLISNQKQAFTDFSEGLYEVPLPIQLSFPERSGDCHIKAGFKKGGDYFVVKVASGFYGSNEAFADGAILVFSQKTGLLQTILCDAGWLTLLRTAVAALIAMEITPWPIQNIGIVGTGRLAVLMQSLILQQYPEAFVRVYGRNKSKAQQLSSAVCESVSDLLLQSDVVISTTAATSPIIKIAEIQNKQHIIALGADDVHKQECHPEIFRRADKIIVDSKVQACKFGDTFYALQSGIIRLEEIVELGKLLEDGLGSKSKLIITDLTGIAAQDMAMAEFVMELLKSTAVYL